MGILTFFSNRTQKSYWCLPQSYLLQLYDAFPPTTMTNQEQKETHDLTGGVSFTHRCIFKYHSYCQYWYITSSLNLYQPESLILSAFRFLYSSFFLLLWFCSKLSIGVSFRRLFKNNLQSSNISLMYSYISSSTWLPSMPFSTSISPYQPLGFSPLVSHHLVTGRVVSC